jgi:hypothetical protein
MTWREVGQRDLVALVVDGVGSVVQTDVIWEPYRLVDPIGGVVGSVTEFLQELQASGRSSATLRSYALDLLRWFRFLLCTCQVDVDEAATSEPGMPRLIGAMRASRLVSSRF